MGMTVGDLRKIIENVPDDLPIGTTGHFGEFVEADAMDFYVKEQKYFSVKAQNDPEKYLNIPVLDIGEDPD